MFAECLLYAATILGIGHGCEQEKVSVLIELTFFLAKIEVNS